MLRVKVLCVVRLSSMSRETRESRLASSRYYYYLPLPVDYYTTCGRHTLSCLGPAVWGSLGRFYLKHYSSNKLVLFYKVLNGYVISVFIRASSVRFRPI